MNEELIYEEELEAEVEGLDEEEKSLLEALTEVFLKEAASRPMSAKETELMTKGYTRGKEGNILLRTSPTDEDDRRGAEIVASLTRENFEDDIAFDLWNSFSEEDKNSAMSSFQCSDCLLSATQGMEREEIQNLTKKQLDAAMERALHSPHARAGLTELENIIIHLDHSTAPGAEGGPAFQITGNCTRCGMSITRTLISPALRVLSAMGGLLRLARESATKIGRNDPCSCGSGKKYKRCCGRG